MLTTWTVQDGQCRVREGAVSDITASLPLPEQRAAAVAVAEPESLRHAVWIDLLNPTLQEERAVQAALAIEIPTREEMQEIESSSRLYREDETLFLTANFLYGVDNGDFGSTAITFVLTNTTLVTVRYATPKAFSVFGARAQRNPTLLASADAVMLHLFEQVVDRLADILERVGADMDRASQRIFRTANANIESSRKDDQLKAALITLGQVGEVTSRASDTLLGLTRILSFVSAEKATAVRKENQHIIKTLVRDVRSLVEHGNMLNGKAQFLLDAVLGLINVEQTGIIKTFSVVSVALMPPTLIASIYGMNFELMPELKWEIGYPAALVLMVVSAVMPVWYFRRKGWL